MRWPWVSKPVPKRLVALEARLDDLEYALDHLRELLRKMQTRYAAARSVAARANPRPEENPNGDELTTEDFYSGRY